MISKKKKVDIDEEFEKVEAMGSDDHKTGVSSTKEIISHELKKDKEEKEITLEYLERAKLYKRDYILSLTQLLLTKMMEDDFPAGVTYDMRPTSEGVYMELYAKGKVFAQAFRATGMPVYDLNAVDMFVMRAENTVNKLWTIEKPQ